MRGVVSKEKGVLDKFRHGERFLWGKFLAAAGHLGAVVLVLVLSSIYPPNWVAQSQGAAASEEASRIRQLLIESLDTYARYQQYHREVYGRFARDLRNLGVPENASGGKLDELRRYYEISVMEANTKRFLILASAQPAVSVELGLRADRVTIDERYRLNANFPLPPMNRKYLADAADRILGLKLRGRSPELGLGGDFWTFEQHQDVDRQRWIAVGRRGAAVGTLRQASFENDTSRTLASIFTQVKKRIETRAVRKSAAPTGPEFDVAAMNFLLSDARFAQHVHFREKGYYTDQWENLDLVTGFRLSERATQAGNVALEPIELVASGFTMRLKATSGPLLGEVFAINEVGLIKQIRFSDVLVKELKNSAEILGNPTRFQISEVKRAGLPDQRQPAGVGEDYIAPDSLGPQDDSEQP